MARNTSIPSLTYGNVTLYPEDLSLVDPPNWMNDSLMTFYVTYLKRELYSDVLSEHACAVLEPSVAFWILQAPLEDSKEEIFSLALHEKLWVIVPISDHDDINSSGGTHWTTLAISTVYRQGFHFDSGQTANAANYENAQRFTKIILNALTAENAAAVNDDFVVHQCYCTKQENGYDCGYHTCANIEALLQAMPVYPQRLMMEQITSYPVEAADQVRTKCTGRLKALLRQHFGG